jgi:hypothetical protein
MYFRLGPEGLPITARIVQYIQNTIAFTPCCCCTILYNVSESYPFQYLLEDFLSSVADDKG